MGILIDSSVLIASERGQLDLSGLLQEQGDEDVAISAITASELLHGLHRAGAEHRAVREAYMERLLLSFPVIPFELVTARTHARLTAELASSGVALAPHDLLIAATALSIGYRLATRDQRSFALIPELNTLTW